MNIVFSEGASTKDFEKEIEAQMDKQFQHFEKELAKIRTGRSHPSMIEDIRISCYGSTMPLKEVASVSAPEATLLVVQPWDKSLIPEIEKAIYNSELGAAPVTDEDIIRIPLPKMSSARRDELIKLLSQKLEVTKIALRNVRKDIQNIIRDSEKSKKISQDYSKRLQDILQKITDKFIESTDKLSGKKEGELKLL